MEQTYPKVAVVVLAWNGKKFLKQFIPPLLNTTYPNAELIVADNQSTDDSVEWLKANYPQITVIQNPENKGFATGYNMALKKVEADYYVLLNQDVEVTPDWIEPVIEILNSDSNIGAAQPKIRAFHQKDHFEYAGAAGGYVDYLGYPFCRGRIFDTVEKDEGQYDTVKDIFWATGACLFIKADLYHQLGGLDDDFFAHMEEIDLCWRLKNAGYSIKYCPDSIVYHVGGGSLPQGNPRKTYLNFRNNLSMMVKNYPAKNFPWTIFLRLVLDGVAAIKSLLSGQLGDFMAVLKAHLYFWGNLGSLLKKRKAVKAITSSIAKDSSATLYPKSIIWQYFAKGKKKFSELPTDPYQ